MSRYLAKCDSKLAALSEVVDADPVLHGLAQTPLMLSVMSLAFRGAGADALASLALRD